MKEMIYPVRGLKKILNGINRIRTNRLFGLGLLMLFAASCTAGDARFTETTPAGFWEGLWHGIISWVMLVAGLFSDTIGVYEVNNTGGWYDFGFLLGIGLIWGSAGKGKTKVRFSKGRSKDDVEATIEREFESRFEKKFYDKCREWAEEEDEKEWEEIAEKVKNKIKRELKNWAEKE